MVEEQIEIDTEEPTEKENEPIDLSQYSFVYEWNLDKGTINLFKSEIPSEVNNYFSSLTANKVVKPNWDPYELEWLAMKNSTHRRCIELEATLITGFGYYIRNKDHPNYKKLETFLKRPNDNFGDTFSKISMNVRRIENTFGSGGLFINKALDKIQMFASTNFKSIFVIPKTIKGRRSIKIRKYIQMSRDGNNHIEYFPYDGEPKAGRKYLYRFGYKIFSNSYYPEPKYLAVLGKINEDLYVDQNNIDFFINRARMDVVFIFSKSKLGTKTQDELKKQWQEEMKGFKGLGKQHKTMFIQAAPGSEVKIHDLARGEDGQYSKRQQTLEYAIARSHGIMPKLLLLLSGGSSGFQGGSASVGDLFLQNQILIRPEQRDYEETWDLILESLFHFNPRIKFRTIDTNNQKDMAIILNTLAGLKIIGQKEGRNYIAEHGLMEIEPDKMPTDIIDIKAGIKPNKDGDTRNQDGSLEQNQDDITSIDEDKFDK